MGFDYATFSDHVVIPTAIAAEYPYSASGEFPSGAIGERHEQLTEIAWLAAKTTRLRLVTSVMVVPHRPAVLTAKILSTIDVLSGGRLTLGIGAGWMREEFEAIDAPDFDARGTVTDEYVRAFGAGDLDRVNVGGAIASQTVQLAGMLQLRLTRVFSLTASGRYQVYTGNLAFNGTSNLDPYTTVTVDGRAMPAVAHPWQAIGGIALLWTHVHLIVGAGYGYYFIPGVQLAYPKQTFVPDASFSVLL